MNKKDEIFEINGKKYKLCYDFTGDGEPGSECVNCPLQDACHDADELICKTVAGEDASTHKRFFEVETPEPETLTEEQVYDYYQERSVKAGERADMLAWALVGMLCAQVIGDHAYLEFYVGGACGIMYMLLSMLQAVWQTVTAWIFKNIIHRTGDTPEDYPEWVGGGAWAFYWLKMTMLTIGTIYVAYRFASPLFNL